MYEVLEITSDLVLLIGLVYFAWYDHRFKMVPLLPIWLLGTIGIVWNLFFSGRDIWNLMASMSVGGLLLLISYLSAESIGMGDGCLFLVSGSFLSFGENMELLVGTIGLLGGFAILCLILKKKKQKDRIAMAPFMLVAYVVFALWK